MEKKFDAVALGEALIDFTSHGYSVQNNALYEANPGGAPCNVLSMLSTLEHKTAFIGKVGRDLFGKELEKALKEKNIDIQNLVFDEEVPTTLAFVKNLEKGEREFAFFRNPGADMMLSKHELKEEILQNTKIFHFGTLSMSDSMCDKATRRAVEVAKENNAIISFDPNIRQSLWKKEADARKAFVFGLEHCDILKISDNEVEWFTKEKDYFKGIETIRENNQISMILLSMGTNGSRVYYKDMVIEEKAFLQENTVDTTGAGDTFGACCLHFILKYGFDQFDEISLHEMLKFANAAAALVTTKKGAFRVMPKEAEVLQMILQEQRNRSKMIENECQI